MNLCMAATTFCVLTIACALPLAAQERGAWRAASKTAQSITGDVTFGDERMTINFFTLPVAEIRPLKPEEVAAVFSEATADAPAHVGHLFRVSIPGDRRFLHKNTLCGSDETQWMVTYVSGKQLRLAFFSNAKPPVFTAEGMNENVNFCGTYTYVR